MAETEPLVQGDDPVLATALSELESEGALNDEPTTVETSAEPSSDPAAAPATPETPAGDAEPTASTAPQAGGAAAAPAPAEDPLAGTEPLTYEVDGQSRAFGDILIDKKNGGFGMILPDKVQAVSAKLLEGERASAQVQQLYGQVQQYERLGGVQGYARLKAENDANVAAGLYLMKTLADAFPGPQYAEQLKGVFEKAEFMMQKTAFETQQKFAGDLNMQRVQAQAGQNEVQVFEQSFPQYQKALPALTPADIEAGKQVFAQRRELLYRQATPQDAQQFQVKVGERIYDPRLMNDWFTERAAWRAQQVAEAKARETAAAAANKFNQGQQQGRQPVKTGSRRAPVAPTPAGGTVKSSRSEAWANPLNEALSELGIDD